MSPTYQLSKLEVVFKHLSELSLSACHEDDSRTEIISKGLFGTYYFILFGRNKMK
jgi:hypothetical protein